MKINELRRYRTLADELECVEEQLSAKKVYDSVQGNSGAPAFGKVTKKVEGYIHGSGTVDLLRRKSQIQKDMDYIETYIAGIIRSDIRKALTLYCIKGYKTWEEVADTMDFEDWRNLRRNVQNELDRIDVQYAQSEE